jgi:hypothetical protein
MSTMTVIWTALPNGLTGNVANRRLRLSAYVSMRLSTDAGQEGVLGDFPAALNWPSLLQPGVFSINVSGDGTAPVTANVVSAAPDPVLWQSIFAATTRVASHQFDDFTGRPFNTYRAGAVHDQLRTGHQQLSGVSPVALPTRQQLQDALPELHRAFAPDGMQPLPAINLSEAIPLSEIQRIQNIAANNLFLSANGTNVHTNMAHLVSTARRLAAGAPPGAAIRVVPDDGSPEAMFKQLYGFHYREPVDPQNPPPALPVTDATTVLDFHQALTALAQYPELLRRLGLVLDLEIPEASLPQSPLSIGGGHVTLTPVLSGSPALTSFTPSTAYFLDGDFIFTSASNNLAEPESIAGLLNLAMPGGFSVIQIDVDGLGLKTINMAATNTLSVAEDEDDTGGTPVPSAPGISILRTDHTAIFTQRFATALQNNQQLGANPPQPVILFAEDLTRGYRFDVTDGTSGWRSLHARTGNYVFSEHPDGPLSFTINDEGIAQPAAAQRIDGTPEGQAQLFVHDSLMLWKGWSLAAPRPGSAIGKVGPVSVTNQTIAGGLPLQVNFTAVPGTLPRLRFHKNYQVRARAVDLAGNSISLGEADSVLTNFFPEVARPLPVLPANPNDLVFRRFEPVLAPHLVAREKFSEGESLARMVIRSNGAEAAPDCSSRLMSVVASSRPADGVIYTATNDRHIVPPKISQIAAEMHGMLDASFGTGVGFQSTYGLARKEKGKFTDTAILDTTTGDTVPIPDTDGLDPLTGEPITRPAVELVITGKNSNPPNGYAVHHEPQMTLPYLPDPIARGATLCGVPGMAQGNSGVLDEQGNLVIVPSTLPPGTIAIIGSIMQIDFGEKTNWPTYLPFRLQLAEPSNPDDPSGIPAWDPQNRILTIHLAKAEQATVRLSSYIDTNDLDVLGIWGWILGRNALAGMSPPDAGDAETAIVGCNWMLTPFHLIRLLHAVQQPLLAPQLQSLVTPRDVSATFAYIGATVPIHGKSTARLDLAAKWQENVDDLSLPAPTIRSVNAHVYEFTIHLPEDAADGPPLPVGTQPIGSYDVPTDTVTLNAPIGGPQGRTFLSRHEFGDTKHRTVTYQMTATTRFREYFPPEITNLAANITQVGPSGSVEVPSSARPAAPTVLYAIPMFEWSRITNPDGSQVRTRIGGGIRVYLARPWYSSGDGEMLAVVLALPANFPPDTMHKSFVTTWGNDPIVSTNALTAPLQPGDFSLAATRADGFLIAEASDLVVAIAAHDVAFDTDRQLWYCDIRVNSGLVYSPFIRLSLARYQPNSIRDVELSNIALADFVQLMPDRTVTVTPDPGNEFTIQIRVDGLTYQSTSWHRGDDEVDITGKNHGFEVNPDVPLVQVSVEERIPGTIDEVGWIPSTDPGINIAAASAVFAGKNTPPGSPLWLGKVTVPEANSFRVVIRESEHFLNDEVGRHTFSVFNPVTHTVVSETKTFHPGAGRLVFAEIIEI